MVNCEPLPGSLCTSILPPWASTIFRVVGNPSPLPPERSRKERVEDPGTHFCRHSDSGVDHIEHDPRPVAAGRENQLSARGHRMLGVQDEVKQGLLEQVGVQAHGRQTGRQVGADDDPAGDQVGLVKVADLVDHGTQIGGGELEVANPRKAQEVFEDRVQALDFVAQALDTIAHAPIPGCFRVLEVLQEQVEVEGEG